MMFGSTSRSSAFGPAFGGFGSTPRQTNPFGSTFQQTQPAFGCNMCGSTSPFGASQPAFGASINPAFGATGTPAFGATTTPTFCATTTPAFGASQPAFGVSISPAFGASQPPFGASISPAFGATTTPAFCATTTLAFGATNTSAFSSTGSEFGASSAPAFGAGWAFGASSTLGFGSASSPSFGASSTPAFGVSSTPAFGTSSTPAFGTSNTPSFSFGSSPAFGQTTSFGSSNSPFGTTQSPFRPQTFAFGTQASTPSFDESAGFGQAVFGAQQREGSRVAPYNPTTEVDGCTSTQGAGKLKSISTMAVYKHKSHEELRWEDYQLGDKGGPNPAGQPVAGGMDFGAPAQRKPFDFSTSNQPSTDPFSSTTSSRPVMVKGPLPGAFGSSTASAFSSSPFGTSSTTNLFRTTNSSTTPSLLGKPPIFLFGPSTSPSPFGISSTSSFASSPFGPTSTPGTNAIFGLNNNTHSAGLFQSTTPSLGQASSCFGQTTSAFGHSTTTPSFQFNYMFGTPSSTGFGVLFNSTPSLSSTSNGIVGQTTVSPISGFCAPVQSNPFGTTTFNQLSTSPFLSTTSSYPFTASAPAFVPSTIPSLSFNFYFS